MVHEIIGRYCQHLQNAYNKFYSDYWPCGYRDKRGRPCVNVLNKHHKGHQLADGKIADTGAYIATDNLHVTGAEEFIDRVKLIYIVFLNEVNPHLHLQRSLSLNVPSQRSLSPNAPSQIGRAHV